MYKSVLFTLLILSMLLAACSGGNIAATVEPTLVAPQPTSTTEPTTAPTLTVEAPTPTPPPNGELALLRANPWQWVSFTNPVEQFDVETPESYTLTFNEDGTVNIVADCNNAIGSYTTDGSSISIEVGPMTMAACPPESRSDDFIKYLGFAAIYFYQTATCTSTCLRMAARWPFLLPAKRVWLNPVRSPRPVICRGLSRRMSALSPARRPGYQV